MSKIALLIPWEDIEGEAIAQIMRIAEYPFTKRMAIMPDVHTGYDMPIGGAALMDGVISPSFVGYDIGCGMCFVTTDIDGDKLNQRQRTMLFESINRAIPAGLGGAHTSTPADDRVILPSAFKSACESKELDAAVGNKAIAQFGTLGSNNHFISIGVNKIGKLCVTVHSGSRNIGHTVATHYINLAKKSLVDRVPGFLPIDSELGAAYAKDMKWCLDYAHGSRLHMLSEVLRLLNRDTRYFSVVNETHNHAVIRDDGVLHRKGATPANSGELGVIPGNMRDGIVLTVGLGNEEFLCSSSHGAGRKMSRSKARNKIPLDKFKRAMKGIVAAVDKHTIEESPFAYKDLKTVIKRQEGIVIKELDKIRTIINVQR